MKTTRSAPWTYAGQTHDDPNWIKRRLQNRRLDDALRLLPKDALRVADFGGGDGELCARLLGRRPGARVICFEPTTPFRLEAELRLRGLTGAQIVADETAVEDGWADAVFCTEVFEHLPPAQTQNAFVQICRMLRPGGVLIAGVPVETGPPALAKGLFRMARRPDQIDGRPGPILRATLGRVAGLPRHLLEIEPGRPYFTAHLGFDHRAFASKLSDAFTIEMRRCSPIGAFPPALSSEVYYVARPKRLGPQGPSD